MSIPYYLSLFAPPLRYPCRRRFRPLYACLVFSILPQRSVIGGALWPRRLVRCVQYNYGCQKSDHARDSWADTESQEQKYSSLSDLDDVIYLGTASKQPRSKPTRPCVTKHSLVPALGSGTSPRSQPLQASRKRANCARNNTDRRRWTARQNTDANRTPDTTLSNRRTICRSKDPALTHRKIRGRSIMPDGVVGRLVKVGWSQTSVGEKVRPAVYASFNRAGRLCYRLDAGMLNCRRDGTRRGKSMPIAFKDVEFGRKLSGLAPTQVRSELLRTLESKLGPFPNFGEV